MMCKARLLEHQKEGVEFLLAHPKAILADEMGLGKTAQIMCALRILFRAHRIRRALIVVPSSLKVNWLNEASLWAPEVHVALYEGANRTGWINGGCPCLIGSYDTMVRDLDLHMLNDIGIDVLVIDEAHFLKTAGTARVAALSNLLAPRRWAVTGTPVENRPDDLASIIRVLFPAEFPQFDPKEDLGRLLQLRDQLVLRRRRRDVGFALPAKLNATIGLDLSAAHREEYDRVVRKAVGERSVLKAVQNLIVAATITQGGNSTKLDWLAERLRSFILDGRRVVVFSAFPNLMFSLLRDRLPAKQVVEISGRLCSNKRNHSAAMFKAYDGPRVLLASLKAAGVGHNWTSASNVIHATLWWNPQVLRQAEDRVYRIGQQNDVIVETVYMRNTIEDAMLKLMHQKETLFQSLIDEGRSANTWRNELEKLIGAEV